MHPSLLELATCPGHSYRISISISIYICIYMYFFFKLDVKCASRNLVYKGVHGISSTVLMQLITASCCRWPFLAPMGRLIGEAGSGDCFWCVCLWGWWGSLLWPSPGPSVCFSRCSFIFFATSALPRWPPASLHFSPLATVSALKKLILSEPHKTI